MDKPFHFPFKSNKYFKGKLLTANDFENEQTYFNNKRRLLNKFLHGSGIVSGLKISKEDDECITLESGLAIDQSGREIIVGSSHKVQVKTIEGFPEDNKANSVYLYIQYHQVEAANNLIYEKYKLVLRDKKIKKNADDFSSLMEISTVLYESSLVKISHKAPKYIYYGQVFELTLHIEKYSPTSRLALAYEIVSDQFELVNQDGNFSKIMFTEPSDTNAVKMEYIETFRIKSVNLDDWDNKGTISIKPDSTLLRLGNDKLNIDEKSIDPLEISWTGDELMKEQILSDYFSRSFDLSLDEEADQSICLAKIELDYYEGTYAIASVHPISNQTYVHNPSILHQLDKTIKMPWEVLMKLSTSLDVIESDAAPQILSRYNQEKHEYSIHLEIPKVNNPNLIATDVYDIPIEHTEWRPFSKFERSFYSDEIDHGLGEGDFLIQLGLVDLQNNQVITGDAEVFRNTPFETEIPKLSLGAITNPKNGKFRIGIKLQQATEMPWITVRWWAMKFPNGNAT
jgi:hypothetical protein